MLHVIFKMMHTVESLGLQDQILFKKKNTKGHFETLSLLMVEETLFLAVFQKRQKSRVQKAKTQMELNG